MIKVAVIGAGNMGRHHARNYSEILGANLVALSDVDLEKKSIAEEYGCKFYESYIEMLDKEDIDAVSVVVPSKYHYKVALEIIKRGKHLLIEKPITETVEEARSLINAAKEKNVKIMVGHIERFNPVIRKLKEVLDSGEIGEIISVVARRVGGYPKNIQESNVITDLAVHDIDLFNYLLGKTPVSVNCHKARTNKDGRIDSAEILIDYGGTGCVSQVNWITPTKIRTLSLTGTLGHLEIDYIKQEIMLHRSENLSSSFKTFNEYVSKFGDSINRKIEVDRKEEPLRVEIESFLKSISDDEVPQVSGADGLKALEIAVEALGEEESPKIRKGPNRVGVEFNDFCIISGNPKIGKDTWIGYFTFIDGSGGLEIGEHCSIASGVHIYTHDSVRWSSQNLEKDYENYTHVDRSEVKIGNNVFIGANTVVLRGVTIGDRAIIGACSLVNKDIPSGCVAVGNPIKIIEGGKQG